MSPNEENSTPTGATIRTNMVYLLDTTKTIVDVQVADGQWMVSAGQPSKPPPKITQSPTSSGYSYAIKFDAGREGTSAVADSFNTLCGGAHNQFCSSSFDGSPNDLNFYFGLNLFLKSGETTTEVPVYLAQGSNWSNNWWIGGANISYLGVLSTTGAGAVTLYIQASISDTNGFTFTSTPPNNAD